MPGRSHSIGFFGNWFLWSLRWSFPWFHANSFLAVVDEQEARKTAFCPKKKLLIWHDNFFPCLPYLYQLFVCRCTMPRRSGEPYSSNSSWTKAFRRRRLDTTITTATTTRTMTTLSNPARCGWSVIKSTRSLAKDRLVRLVSSRVVFKKWPGLFDGWPSQGGQWWS